MRKEILALGLSSLLVLSGCWGGDTDENETPTENNTQTEQTTDNSGMTPECTEYFDFMEACIEKLDPSIAASYTQGFDAAKQQLTTMPDAQASQFCSQSLEQTKPAMAQMGCE